MTIHKPSVGLFVTCLVDAMAAEVAFASKKILENAGCKVLIPKTQTCCGQPAYNSGDNQTTADLAKQHIELFDAYDYVVLPSGSCAAMMRHHYMEVFKDDRKWHEKSQNFAKKVYEICDFLVTVMDYTPPKIHENRVVTYHDSCSGLRELGIKQQPRKLLSDAGVKVEEMVDNETCCGFGGTFCVKYSDISDRMVGDKVTHIKNTGADTVAAGDTGCLMNMAGKLSRLGEKHQAKHVVELLV